MEEDYLAMIQLFIRDIEARSKHDMSGEERWVVERFIEINKGSFDIKKLISHPQDSKIDQSYGMCDFQIKKILYPEDFKPKLEAKIFKNRLSQVDSYKDFIDATVSDSALSGEYLEQEYTKNRILNEIKHWSEKTSKNKSLSENVLKYPINVRMKLDLLFYIHVDLENAQKRPVGITFDKNFSKRLEPFGWRSISYVYGDLSLVLYVSKDAPRLLKEIYNHQC